MAQFKNSNSAKSLDGKKNRKPRSGDLTAMEREQGSLEDLGVSFEDDGSAVVDLDVFDENAEETDLGSFDPDSDFYRNLTEEIDEEELANLGMLVKEGFEADKASREEWENMLQDGANLLGLKLEQLNTPFKGACSAHHPLIMENAVKFQSKASAELLPANGPVRCKIIGESSIDKEKQANRVVHHMNYQVTEEMTEFYPDTERMLLYVAINGSGFKKTYYSSKLQRPVSEFIPASQLVVSNNATDLYRCPRYTHILNKTHNMIEADYTSGFYTRPEINLNSTTRSAMDPVQDTLFDISGINNDVVVTLDGNQDNTFLEQHVDLVIDSLNDNDDGLACPYIVTIVADTGVVVGVRRNWKEGDKLQRKRVPFTHYNFVPGFGFYSFGYLHLLGNLQLSLTSSLRSIVDAGQFSNLQGGFKLKGVRIVDNGEPIAPGQFKEIDAGILDIQKAIMNLPFKEPSQVLFAAMEWMDAKGQKFADATESVIGDSSNYGPVGTTLALLDASTKFFSAIHKRLHFSQKQELRLIAEINSETLPEDLPYNKYAGYLAVSREDYDDRIDVVPVSDPNISSNAHRMAKAQTILQVAQMAPEQHDMREVLKHFYTSMDFEDVDKLMPEPETAQMNDPVSDLMAAQQGKPIKAFPGQDHEAHIKLKMAFLNDPKSGKNQMMMKAATAVQANIQEHMMLQFVESIQAQTGDTDDEQALAMAAEKTAQLNQQKLQAEMEAANANNMEQQAALILANAEMMDSQTEARKQAFNEKIQVADIELKKEQLDMKKFEEARRATQFNQKLKHDMDKEVVTAGLDAMIEGMKPVLKQKEPKAETSKKEKPTGGNDKR